MTELMTESAVSAAEQAEWIKQYSTAVTNFLNAVEAMIKLRKRLQERGEASAWMADEGTPGHGISSRIADGAVAIDAIESAMNAAGVRLKLSKVAGIR